MLFDVSFFMYGVSSLLGFVGYFYKAKKGSMKATNVEFVIPSTADEKTMSSLMETVENLRRLFPDYKVWIVVDEGSRLDGENVVVVPRSYRGKKCKGRALQYFVENYVNPDTWYVFLDDDSFPLDDSFLYEIPYYESKGYVAANGVLTPRNGRSKLCYILDHLRLWDDLFVFRFGTGLLKTPFVGLHGELLIVKGKVLKEIGFSTDSLVEDFRLATEMVRRKYKTWQSRTKVSIKSPNNIKDFWRQRARWIKGILLELPKCSLPTFAFAFLRLIGGLCSSIIWLPFWFLLNPTTPFALFGFFGLAYYLSSYVYGIIKSGKWTYFLLLPILGAAEMLCIPYIAKTKEFTIIDKN